MTPGPCESFYRELARSTDDPILELDCGTGRLTIPLALDGHEVVGLDASPSMLRAVSSKAQDAGAELKLVRDDMRSFELGRTFSLVIVSCNLLAHLTDNKDLADFLGSISRHLTPGGLFAFDVVNPKISELMNHGHESEPPEMPSRGQRLVAYDPVRQVQLLQWRIKEPANEMLITSTELRTFFPQEVGPRLALAG